MSFAEEEAACPLIIQVVEVLNDRATERLGRFLGGMRSQEEKYPEMSASVEENKKVYSRTLAAVSNI
jgi:hypothetical protein